MSCSRSVERRWRKEGAEREGERGSCDGITQSTCEQRSACGTARSCYPAPAWRVRSANSSQLARSVLWDEPRSPLALAGECASAPAQRSPAADDDDEASRCSRRVRRDSAPLCACQHTALSNQAHRFDHPPHSPATRHSRCQQRNSGPTTRQNNDCVHTHVNSKYTGSTPIVFIAVSCSSAAVC